MSGLLFPLPSSLSTGFMRGCCNFVLFPLTLSVFEAWYMLRKCIEGRMRAQVAAHEPILLHQRAALDSGHRL